jgi:hypothetical protein
MPNDSAGTLSEVESESVPRNTYNVLRSSNDALIDGINPNETMSTLVTNEAKVLSPTVTKQPPRPTLTVDDTYG